MLVVYLSFEAKSPQLLQLPVASSLLLYLVNPPRNVPHLAPLVGAADLPMTSSVV